MRAFQSPAPPKKDKAVRKMHVVSFYAKRAELCLLFLGDAACVGVCQACGGEGMIGMMMLIQAECVQHMKTLRTPNPTSSPTRMKRRRLCCL